MSNFAAYLPTASDNHWARGCPNCKYGIVSAPELTGACNLYLERLVQMIAGDITFCTCQAGTRYRVNLLNRRQALIEEARKDPRMAEQAQRLTHVDIENSMRAMQMSYARMAAPSVHFEPQEAA